MWGPIGEINDYAAKQWGGLISEYYYKRWKLFLDSLNTVHKIKHFNQTDYAIKCLHTVSQPFNYDFNTTFPTVIRLFQTKLVRSERTLFSIANWVKQNF